MEIRKHHTRKDIPDLDELGTDSQRHLVNGSELAGMWLVRLNLSLQHSACIISLALPWLNHPFQSSTIFMCLKLS